MPAKGQPYKKPMAKKPMDKKKPMAKKKPMKKGMK
jgi:hypothetical protein